MKSLIVSLLFLITATVSLAQSNYTPPGTPDERLYKTYGIHLFRGVEGTWFDLQNDNGTSGAISYTNILDWLQGRVAGLQVYAFRDVKVPFLRSRPASIFVDEMRVDYSFLNVLSIADIALIKVMPMASVAGIYTQGGAIAIYTKRGEAEEEEQR